MTICYQALTNGRMEVTAFNGGGLLGEERTLLGDLSGGYTVRLHEYSPCRSRARWVSTSIAVAQRRHRRRRAQARDAVLDGRERALYQAGINLAWRTRDGIWKERNGRADHPAQRPVPEVRTAPPYNTPSSVVEAVAGPFQFSGTTIRVLPLLAHQDCRSSSTVYINKATGNPQCERRV